MIKAVFIPVPIQWEGKPKNYDQKVDRMMTKREVCDAFGVSSTNPERKKIFGRLNKYNNPFSQTAIFKASEVQDLLNTLEIDRSQN